MGLRHEDDKRPSKLAIMDDISDTPQHPYVLDLEQQSPCLEGFPLNVG
ncbi:hypothetical protein KGM_206347 [Danaus plexippus plexippus]|uniref:Uncharacterized protein n=1 Tax=Danaus plexippus plexippus TaxID=278856 RepID=A0A212EPR2_DANPL|nr:hypothetical protein KGM_206347 [Danaus plexippus plexippus]